MNSYNNFSNKSKQSSNEPMLLRMLHPTSGRQGFNVTNNQPAFLSSSTVDPRLHMMINAQAQHAITASGLPIGFPYQGSPIPQSSPHFYGIYQPYSIYPR